MPVVAVVDLKEATQLRCANCGALFAMSKDLYDLTRKLSDETRCNDLYILEAIIAHTPLKCCKEPYVLYK